MKRVEVYEREYGYGYEKDKFGFHTKVKNLKDNIEHKLSLEYIHLYSSPITVGIENSFLLYENGCGLLRINTSTEKHRDNYSKIVSIEIMPHISELPISIYSILEKEGFTKVTKQKSA